MLIEAHKVWKTYQRGSLQIDALRGLDLELPVGAFAMIVGPSGGGKSTLLHLLGGMDHPTQGTLQVCGMQLERASEADLNRFRREQLGFIFQSYNLIPSLNAVENVALALLAQGQPRHTALQQAGALLARVGLDSRMRHKPAELSGGEQQRVAVARAIANQTKLVLADEPTGDLDDTAADTVMQLLLELNRQLGTTFVIATHNLRYRPLATHWLELHSGSFSTG
jgi:ABC-type lipoprotein export system ATPase subunit